MGAVFPERSARRRARLVVLAASAAAAACADYAQVQEVPPPPSSSGFGSALSSSADGRTLVAGAPATSSLAGAAFVYALQADATWAQTQLLVASDAAGDSFFGQDLVLSPDGSTLAIGAWNSGSGRGAAYVFSNAAGGPWVQVQKLVPVDSGSGGYCGQYLTSFSPDGSMLALPCWGFNSGAGAVFMYSRVVNATWSQAQKLVPTDSTYGFGFGEATAFSSDGLSLAIGAPVKGSYTGAVYIFTRTASTWAQQQMLTASDAAPDSWFGSSVAFSADGSALAIGARSRATSKGALYLFASNGAAWAQAQILTASDAAAGDLFGARVALTQSDSTLVVSATGKGGGVGAAYTFAFSGGEWAQAQTLTASDSGLGDNFGHSVAISADGFTLLIGGKHTNNVGALYILARPRLMVTSSATASATLSATGSASASATASASASATATASASATVSASASATASASVSALASSLPSWSSSLSSSPSSSSSAFASLSATVSGTGSASATATSGSGAISAAAAQLPYSAAVGLSVGGGMGLGLLVAAALITLSRRKGARRRALVSASGASSVDSWGASSSLALSPRASAAGEYRSYMSPGSSSVGASASSGSGATDVLALSRALSIGVASTARSES